MKPEIKAYIESLEAITPQQLKGYKKLASYVVIEGNGLNRSLKVNGKVLDKNDFIKQKPELTCESFQWNAEFLIGQLLSAYAVLKTIAKANTNVDPYVNLVSEIVFRNMPPNFKVTLDMTAIIAMGCSTQWVTDNGMKMILEQVAVVEELDDPNAPIMGYDPDRAGQLRPGVANIGALINRQ